MKNSERFIKLVQDINLQNEEYLESFEVSLFTNIPVVEVLQVTRNRLDMDPSFPECSPLQVENIMELLYVCLTTTYIQFKNKSYQPKEGIAMGTHYLRYVDTFMVWPHGQARLQQFLHHLNSVRPTIKFTIKVEAHDTLPFSRHFGHKEESKIGHESVFEAQPPTSHKKGSRS
jgi:hypothetical protein